MVEHEMQDPPFTRHPDYTQALEDALDNLLGMLDTPVARRRMGDSLLNEAVRYAKRVREAEVPPVRAHDVEWSVQEEQLAREAGLL